MFKFVSYTVLIVIIADILAVCNLATSWTSPIIPKLYSNTSGNPFDKAITETEKSWIGSLLNIGAMIGPFPFGFLARRFGRKIGLLCVAIPHIISFLTLAFAKSVYLYYFARILAGIALGGGYTLLPMYIAEVAEDSNRGMLSVTMNIFWNVGNLMVYIIGPYTSILWFNIILACIPITFFGLFLLLAPESPYFLVTQNRIEEAEQCLFKLKQSNKKLVENEIYQIKLSMELAAEEEATLLDLFQSKTYIKGLVISLALIIAQQLSGINAVIFYTQQIFTDAGVDGISPEVSSMIVGCICLLSSFGVPFVADRFGRRILLMISCFGSSAAHIAFGIFFYLKFETNYQVSGIFWLPLTSLILYFIMFSIGLGPIPWTVSSELFPTSVKPFAAALISFSCWTASFLVTKFFDDLNHVLGQGGTFWLFGIFCFATFLFVLFYVPETKGKSFGDIQKILEQ